ncbi:hypothetical protein NSERUTF1_2758 [Nocardia seriolae]|nr:hypothetical protein NSERUTF1_2758 [Nocardia seriolae]
MVHQRPVSLGQLFGIGQVIRPIVTHHLMHPLIVVAIRRRSTAPFCYPKSC